MKKLFYLMALMIMTTLSVTAQTTSTPISQLPTYTGNPSGGFVPVSIGPTTRKVDARNLGALDSISVSSGLLYDTIFVMKNGVKQYYKLIRSSLLFTPNGLTSGGYVSWVGNLSFQVSNTFFAVNNKQFYAAATTSPVNLSTADPSLPRIDIIVADTSGNIFAIEGIPATDPAKPQIDPTKQIELTQVLINAGATTPADITISVIYDENTESTFNTNLTANANNTSNPFHLTKAIDVSSHGGGGNIEFTLPTGINLSEYSGFLFYLRLKGTYSNSTSINVEWTKPFGLFDITVSNNVSIVNNNYGYSRMLINQYQLIQIPVSAFTFHSSPAGVNKLTLSWNGAGPGFYIDYIQVQKGLNINSNGVATYNGRAGNVIGVKTDYWAFFGDTSYRRNDSVFWRKNNVEVFQYKDSVGGGGGGAVNSVFGRIGTVTAQEADYSTFYPLLSGSYNNPSWLTGLAPNKILQAGASTGQVLKWNGSAWVPDTDNTGGGGSADSSWVSSETGVAPNQLGYLVNSTLPALPSGWTDVTPAASVTFSGKMIVSGGTTGTSSLSGNTGASTVYSNRIDMDFYPYSKMRYAFTVVPQDKTGSSNGLALHFQANSLFFSTGLRIVFDLSTGSDSGKISMATDFGSVFASSASLIFNAADTLNIEVVRDGWYAIASMRNRRTGKFVDLKHNAFGSAFGTGGKAYLGLLGGSQHITSAKVESYEPKDGTALTIMADSQFAGSGATSEEKIAAYQIVRGNKGKVANLSNGGLTLSAAVLSHVPAAIALNNPVIVSLGFNDRRDLVTDTTTFKTRLAGVVDPLIAAGLPVWVTTLVPTNSTLATFNTNFDLAIINYCAANNIPVIRIDSILKKSGDASNRIKENYLGADAVHWSDSGQYVGAQKVIQIIGERIPSLFADSTSAVTMYNLPTGETNMNRLVVDNNGKVKQVPATTFDAIYNARNYNGVGTIAQVGEIHITLPVKTDSALFIHNSKGIFIGGNGGTALSAGSAGSNIVLSTRGGDGTGHPQAFPAFTGGLRNVIFEPFSNKALASATFSGVDNFISNSAIAGTISGSRIFSISVGANMPAYTGSDIFAWGTDAMRGNSTGNRVINLAIRNTTAASLGNVSDLILFGDITSHNSGDNAYAANDISLNTSYYNNENFWLGGREKPEKIIYVNFPAISTVSNYQGNDGIFRSGRGRGTGRSGYMIFQSWNSTTSGTTLHSAPNTELTIANDLITVDAVLKSNFAQEWKYTGTATGITLDNTHRVVEVTATGQTITLPTAAGNSRVYTIKLTASGTCTVATTSSQTIDGSTTYSLSAQYKYVTVQSNGSNWIIIANN